MIPPDDPDKIPTQPAMPAVRVLPTLEERVKIIEETLVTKVDLQVLVDRQHQYEEKCEDDRRQLRNDVTQLTSSVSRVESKTDKLDIKSDKLDVKMSTVDAKTDAQTLALTRLEEKTDAIQKHGEALVRIEAAVVPAAKAVGGAAQETSRLLKLAADNPRAATFLSIIFGLVIAWAAKQLGVTLP